MKKKLLLLILIPSVFSVSGVGHGDFSNLSFMEAFDSLFINFSTCYPFTEWKAIDWQPLYDEYAPLIASAQSQSDTNAYKLAIRHFIHTFPDGHVRVSGEFQDLFIGEIGGGFGLTLVELENGTIVVNRILAGGPAEQAGIEIGATIINWGGLPVNESLTNTELIWEGKPPAINEAIRLARLRRLVRASIGSQIEINFINHGQSADTEILTAVDDGMATWEISNFSRFGTNGSFIVTIEDILYPVQYNILPSNYGYLKSRILVEFDSQGNILPTYDNIYNSIKEAIDYFNINQVSGVIIDIRDNPGGFDRLAALFGSFFYDHTDLYEHASFYNPQTGQFEVIGAFTIYLEPQVVYYGGSVICLVNAGTASSGEGVPMAIQRLPKGYILGSFGTSGTFGLTSGETLMPGGLKINYPLGRSLDENYNIQLDSDSTKNGGVIPDIRVSLTLENMIAMYVDSVDIELDSAVAYLNSITSSSEKNNNQPYEFQLYQNYPNPFNPFTVITYQIPQPGFVSLKVFDVLGSEIATLVNEEKPAGNNEVNFNGSQLTSGIYLYRLQIGYFSMVKKMTLIK